MRSGISTLLVLPLLLASVALAQQTQPATAPDSPDALAVKAAAKQFVVALDQDTLDAAKKMYAGAPEDFRVVERMHDAVKAARELRAAALKKFPDFEKGRRMSNDLDPKGMGERIDRTPVTVAGDTATFPGDGAKLQKADGQWKVVKLINHPQAVQMVERMMPAITKTMRDTTPEIEQGKYASFDEVEKAMQTRMRDATRAAMAEMMNAATSTAPATRPGR